MRVVSCEPLLGPVSLRPWLDRLDWVIVGGETGPGARPMHPDWVRAIRDECVEAGVPFFFKSWGDWVPEDHWRAEMGRPKYEYPWNYHEWDHYKTGFRSIRVGKKRAGQLLDGEEWNQRPEGRK